MIYSTLLYYTILYYTILYYTIIYYTTSYLQASVSFRLNFFKSLTNWLDVTIVMVWLLETAGATGLAVRKRGCMQLISLPGVSLLRSSRVFVFWRIPLFG